MTGVIPPAPPGPGEVLVCCVEIPRALPPETTARLRAALPDDERARHARYGHEGAAGEFLCGRALLRAALSAWSPVAHDAWRFSLNAHGRPAVEHPASEVFFNLSHTRGLVALALGRDPAVGVDVERLDRAVRPLEVADRFFSPDEVAGLRALPDARHRDRFLALWTLKEAYIKARGMGLALPLREFSFAPDDEPVRVRFAPSLDDDAARWRFARVDLDSGHRVAVAARVERLSVRVLRVDLAALAALVGLPGGVRAV
ncbi:MAG: 4-phosphopantetheinyl transferase [Myxococcaceae bacterium]|nr:4-phosphopantetheinyl transferase [Myxococcaceae bacterium]